MLIINTRPDEITRDDVVKSAAGNQLARGPGVRRAVLDGRDTETCGVSMDATT